MVDVKENPFIIYHIFIMCNDVTFTVLHQNGKYYVYSNLIRNFDLLTMQVIVYCVLFKRLK